MLNTTRLPVRAVARASALALIACTLATSVASAQPKEPVTKNGCTYAGQSYSHGSVRLGQPWISNGKKYATEYTCIDGEWVAGPNQEVPKVKPAPVNPTPADPTPVGPTPAAPPVTLPRAP